MIEKIDRNDFPSHDMSQNDAVLANKINELITALQEKKEYRFNWTEAGKALPKLICNDCRDDCHCYGEDLCECDCTKENGGQESPTTATEMMIELQNQEAIKRKIEDIKKEGYEQGKKYLADKVWEWWNNGSQYDRDLKKILGK